MNRHIGSYVSGVRNDKVTYGGQQLIDMLETGKYVLVNNSNLSTGGPYTRYDRSEPENDELKSVLGLCIISRELESHIDSFIIDKDKEFTPYRVLSKDRVVYTDHYSLKLILKDLPRNVIKGCAPSRGVRWNTNKEGGWSKYLALTTENEVLDQIAQSEDEDSNAIMNKISKEMDRVRHIAFGKVKESGYGIRDKDDKMKVRG